MSSAQPLTILAPRPVIDAWARRLQARIGQDTLSLTEGLPEASVLVPVPLADHDCLHMACCFWCPHKLSDTSDPQEGKYSLDCCGLGLHG